MWPAFYIWHRTCVNVTVCAHFTGASILYGPAEVLQCVCVWAMKQPVCCTCMLKFSKHPSVSVCAPTVLNMSTYTCIMTQKCATKRTNNYCLPVFAGSCYRVRNPIIPQCVLSAASWKSAAELRGCFSCVGEFARMYTCALNTSAPIQPSFLHLLLRAKKIPPELYESGQIRINPMTQGPPHSSTSIHFRKIYKDQIKTHSNGCVSFWVPAEIKIAFLKHISGLIGNNILFHVTEVKCVVNVISRELIIMDYYNKNTVLAQYVVCIKNICILSTIICHMSTPFHYRFVADMTLNSIAPCTQGPPLKNNTFIAEWILRLRHKEAEFHFKLLSQWTFVLKIHTRSKQGWRCAIYPYTIHQNKPCENKQVYLAY